MFAVHLAYTLIKPNDKVLDIGGSASPFRRANSVLDFLPYEKRNLHPSFLSNIPEHFNKDSWFVRDVCDSSKPFPFKDKEFDFVVCGHLLEDIRDPFFVVKEIQRIAKRGYIEVPTRWCEQTYWIEQKGMCGYSHHRWLVDVKKNEKTGENDLSFVFKNHSLHAKKKFQISKPSLFHRGRAYMNSDYQFLGLYFNGPFDAYEDVSQAIDNGERFMLESVEQYKKIGPQYWNINGDIPANIASLDDLKPGLHPLRQHLDRVTQRTKLFDHEKGGAHDEALEFEKTIRY